MTFHAAAPTLRPDQEEPVAAMRALVAQGSRRILLQAPTGWGKGTVAAWSLARAAARSTRSAFICHREEINLDLVARLRAAGADRVRVVMGDHEEGASAADAQVEVISIQTLDARSLSLDHLGLVWVDEAHRAAAPSYLRVFEDSPRPIYVGSTATPARADLKPLTFFTHLVQGPQVQQLVAMGYLAPLRLLAADTATDELTADPVATVMDAGFRDGIVFGHSLEHSRSLAATFNDRGLRAAHVQHGTPGRADIISAFNRGDLDVLCCYRLLAEGVDTWRAKNLVLATQIQSAVTFLQAVGRVRRPLDGATATVYDLMGSFHLHGHPDADRTYHLDGAAGIRLVNAGLGPRPVQCRGCLAWSLPRATCGLCGFRLPPPRPPRISKKELRERRLEAQPRVGPAYDLWSSLAQTQRARGYKPQWAAIQFRATTGDWPRWGLRQVPEVDEVTAAADAATPETSNAA